jgi:SAM-dependent methyltransferase
MEQVKLLKLDLGCGKNKIGPEWVGVDSLNFEGVDVVLDLCAREPNFSEFTYIDNKAKKRKPKSYEAQGVTMPGLCPFKKWPWEDNSVDEVHCSHFIEHLDPSERIHFVNELYRVLKPGCKATIIAPHWASCRSYGDLTHKWPPVSEFWFFYLSKEWRDVNAPHNVDYNCNFVCTWGYSMHPSLNSKNDEYKNYALANYKESAQDVVANFTKS